MAQKIDVSIIIPALNEEAIIGNTLARLTDFVKAQRTTLGVCEIVIVAAGSDKTAEIAKPYVEKFEHFTVITPDERVGKGRDVRLGFLQAKGEVQLFLDADLSVSLSHIPSMVALLKDGSDVVVGRRNLSKIHAGPLRSLVSVATNLLTRATILPRIHDTQCGFKGFTKSAAQTLFKRQQMNGWGFDIELLVHAREASLKVTELPIPDWREARTNELAGARISSAALTTFVELARICGATYWRWLLRHVRYAPLVAGVAAFLVALAVGPFKSIWFDEAYSAMLINQSIPDVVHFTGLDVHPPLYYLILKAWAAIFGHSEFALRSLSMVCGALASAIGIKLVARMFSARAALFAVPFVVFAPMLLRYDIEMRMYAMASLICIAATYVLVRALDTTNERKKLWWIAYAVLVAAGMYTLYYTALIWIVHLVWCIYITKPTFRTLFKQPWMLAFVGAVALFLPWMGWFLWQTVNVQGGFWIGPVTIREVLNVITMVLTFHPQWQLDPWASAVTMIGMAIGLYFVASALHQSTGINRRNLVLLVLYACLPIIVLFVVSLPPLRPVLLERYFSQTLLGAYLLLGVAIALYKPFGFKAKLAAFAMVGVLLTGVVSLHTQTNYNFNTLKQPSAREIVEYIRSQGTDDATIVADHWALYFEVVYYIAGQNVKFYAADGKVSSGGGSAMLYNSPLAVSDSSQLTTKNVYYIFYEKDQLMQVKAPYKLTNIYQVADYKVATYQK